MDYNDFIALFSPLLIIGTLLLTIYYVTAIKRKFPEEKHIKVYAEVSERIIWPVLIYLFVIFAVIGPGMQRKFGFNYIYVILIFLAWLLLGIIISLIFNSLLKKKNNGFFQKEGISPEERKKTNIMRRALSPYTVISGLLSVGYSLLMCGTMLSVVYVVLLNR